MQPRLRQIVIAGGGSAGWMTAAALSSLLDPKDVSITLVESDEIGTVGVGEATIPDIINFNRMLGLDEQEFMKATNATFKLGIEFIDWGRKGDAYIHPFSVHGVDMKGIDFHNYWLHERAGGGQHAIQNYSLCAVAASQGKFILPDPSPRSLLAHIRYAYHFDATLYARFLRAYAEARGVRRVEGKIQQVSQAPETGNLVALQLDNDRTVSGDFFFELHIVGKSRELIDVHERVLRGDLELASAGLAHHLVIEPQQVVTELRELRLIRVIGVRGGPILLCSPHPSDPVLRRSPALRALVASRPCFWFFGEKRALVEGHGDHSSAAPAVGWMSFA